MKLKTVVLVIFLLVAVDSSFAQNTFATLNRNQTFQGTQTFKNITSGSVSGFLYVDGVTYPTVQSAINALPAGGGTVLIPAGNHACPTSIPTGTRLVGLPGDLPITQGFYFGLIGIDYGTQNLVVFQCSSTFTLTNVMNVTMSGIVVDMQASGGMVLSGVTGSKFDMMVTNCKSTSVCLTIQGGSAPYVNTGFNDFPRLLLYGGSESLLMDGTITGVVTNNHFGHVIAFPAYSSTRIVEFKQNADTNVIDQLLLFYGATGTHVVGVAFNTTGTPAANVDTNANYIGWLSFTSGAILDASSSLIYANNSFANFVRTGDGANVFTSANVYKLANGADITIESMGPQYSGTTTKPQTTSTGFNRSSRFSANQGTPYSGISDPALVISAGWGTTATSAIGGWDQNFSFSVSSSGTGQSANPTLTITFKDGAWDHPPRYVCVRDDNASPLSSGPPITYSTTTTTLNMYFIGTPVAGNTYQFNCITM